MALKILIYFSKTNLQSCTDRLFASHSSDTKQIDECFPVVTDLQSGAPQRPVSTQIARHS